MIAGSGCLLIVCDYRIGEARRPLPLPAGSLSGVPDKVAQIPDRMIAPHGAAKEFSSSRRSSSEPLIQTWAVYQPFDRGLYCSCRAGSTSNPPFLYLTIFGNTA